jgi:hypothetical protein
MALLARLMTGLKDNTVLEQLNADGISLENESPELAIAGYAALASCLPFLSLKSLSLASRRGSVGMENHASTERQEFLLQGFVQNTSLVDISIAGLVLRRRKESHNGILSHS